MLTDGVRLARTSAAHLEAVLQRDYPVLLGIFLILSIIVIALDLVTDLIYGLIDPRMTTEAA